MRGVIRLGDPTSHGGKVVSASPDSFASGIAVARQGDACTCPCRGHGLCRIAEGDDSVRIDGVAVAFDGHRTTCGARLISTLAISGKN